LIELCIGLNLIMFFPLIFKDGKYREALGKWEAAITLTPEKTVLHEQKAQVLLELGDSWGALKAATSALHSSLSVYFSC
jgi:predicted Zn-dependent protease